MEILKAYLLLLCVLITAGISLITIIPGYVTADEATYHLMAKNFLESGGFEVWNGYREYPSPELHPIPLAVVIRNGRLVPQPPYLLAVLGAGLYKLAGFQGLFYLNILAFAGTVVLCYGIARQLFHDRKLAFNAALIFGLATYSYEYAQAIWPHLTAVFFMLAALYVFLRALSVDTQRRALLLAFASGAIAGCAPGIRPDTIAILLTILLCCFLQTPWRPGLALVVCLGTLPGLVILSATNYAKFGIFFPFSYGSSAILLEGTYALPFAGLILAGLIAVWGITRYFAVIRSGLRRYRYLVMIIAIALMIGLTMFPPLRPTIVKHAKYAYQILVDLRAYYRWQRWWPQTQSGAVTYLGGFKKSLLQSCPYLLVLLIPLLKIVRRERDRVPLVLVFFIPVVFIGFYSLSPLPGTDAAWHGALCLNMRYLLPILPFTSILLAYVWRELTRNLPWQQYGRIAAGTSAITIFVYFFILRPAYQTAEQQEFLYLTLPLILAGILGILVVMREIMLRGKGYPKKICNASWQKRVSLALVSIMMMTMVWAGLVEFFYDYPLVRHARKRNLDTTIQAAEVVADDSLFFTTRPAFFFGLSEHKRVRFAAPNNDHFRDFSSLLVFHLQQGRTVYGAFTFQEWNRIKRNKLLDPHTFKIRQPILFSEIVLCRIIPSEEER